MRLLQLGEDAALKYKRWRLFRESLDYDHSLQQEGMHSGYGVRMRIESDRLYITKIKRAIKNQKQKTLVTVNGAEEDGKQTEMKVMVTTKT